MSQVHPPELERLLALIETNLFVFAKADLTRDQAVDIQERIQRPLGVLGSKHGLRSVRERKQSVRGMNVEKALT